MSKPVVAIVGRPNVGKSTLFNKLVGSRLSIVDDTPGVTRDRIYGDCEWGSRTLLLVDTGGIEPYSDDIILKQMRRQAQLAIDSADVIILVTDVRSGVVSTDSEVASMLQKSGKPIVLCVNKCDTVGEPPAEYYEFYNLGLGDPIAVSSVHGMGTGDLLDAVCEHLPPADEEEEEDDEDDFAEEDDIEDIFVDDASDQKQDGGVILPVILPESGEARKIYVRYIFSFRAKLIQAPQEIQQRYGELADEVNSYYRVKMSVSWKQVRIYAGRNTLAMLLFKGRKLCMAFALDPKEYEETKYRGKDLSDIKRFQKTPMLLKLTSPRKVRYAKHLFADVAAKYGLEKGETVRTEFYLPYRTTDELVENKLVKRYVSGQEGEGGEIVRANIGEIIRNRVTLREAQAAISDEEAAELIEHEVAASLDYEDSEAPRGTKRGIINIDTLSKNFETDDTVTLEALIEKGLVPKKVGSVKVLARGILDKPLTVEAQDFSIDAVKMIVLTGGKAVKVK